jgi:hypothetical protein
LAARRRAHARTRDGVVTLVALDPERYKEQDARMWNVSGSGA